MGYNTHVRLLVREAAGGWDDPTVDQLDALFAFSEDAQYNQDNGESKWYALTEDMGRWSAALGCDVRADVMGEDGEQWRVYARNGDAVEVKPEITYREPWATRPQPTAVPDHEGG